MPFLAWVHEVKELALQPACHSIQNKALRYKINKYLIVRIAGSNPPWAYLSLFYE